MKDLLKPLRFLTFNYYFDKEDTKWWHRVLMGIAEISVFVFLYRIETISWLVPIYIFFILEGLYHVIDGLTIKIKNLNEPPYKHRSTVFQVLAVFFVFFCIYYFLEQ